MKASRHALVAAFVLAVMAATAASQAFCWGSLYVVSRSSFMLTQCPTPSLTRIWRIRCYNGCGYSDGSFSRGLTGVGECFKNQACQAPQIVCLPLAGSEIRGYNPPSLSAAIVNRQGYYQMLPCDFPSCRSAGVNTMTVHCNCDSGGNPAWCGRNDPVIVSLGDASYRLTDLAGGVEFDLGGEGFARRLPWTHRDSDEAFLVLDRNGNGVIDNGMELFGDVTPQHVSAAPNGFRALAMFDDALSGGNEDGRISSDDEIFARLELWLDRNHNGLSEPEELQTLPQAGLESIALGFRESGRVDRHGNEFRYLADSRWSDGSRRRIWNVFLVAN